MGVALSRILQRAFPLLKEQAKQIQALEQQAIIQEQQIELLQCQKQMIEESVVHLSSELKFKETLIEELRQNSKRLLFVGGVATLGALWYIRKLDAEIEEIQLEHYNNEDDGDIDSDTNESQHIPESMECIVCMENAKEIMMEPCGHVCICRQCAETMRLASGRVKCPVCRIRADTRTVFIT